MYPSAPPMMQPPPYSAQAKRRGEIDPLLCPHNHGLYPVLKGRFNIELDEGGEKRGEEEDEEDRDSFISEESGEGNLEGERRPPPQDSLNLKKMGGHRKGCSL